jgi:hypothetical protein
MGFVKNVQLIRESYECMRIVYIIFGAYESTLLNYVVRKNVQATDRIYGNVYIVDG